jgi:hypothetical protein
MKITDLSLSPFSFKVVFTEDMEEYLMEIFTDFLEDRNLISKSVLNKTLGIWIESVPYQEFSELFDAFWKQMIDEIPGGKIIETIGCIGIQTVSVFQRMKPPERSIFRETAKTKIAIKLLDSIA